MSEVQSMGFSGPDVLGDYTGHLHWVSTLNELGPIITSHKAQLTWCFGLIWSRMSSPWPVQVWTEVWSWQPLTGQTGIIYLWLILLQNNSVSSLPGSGLYLCYVALEIKWLLKLGLIMLIFGQSPYTAPHSLCFLNYWAPFHPSRLFLMENS